MLKQDNENVQLGDIFWVEGCEGVTGSEMKKVRPAVVVSNDKCNHFSPLITICFLTKAENKTKMLPTHVYVPEGVVKEDSIVMCETITTIDRSRLKSRISYLDKIDRLAVKKACAVQLAISESDLSGEFTNAEQSVADRIAYLESQVETLMADNETLELKLDERIDQNTQLQGELNAKCAALAMCLGEADRCEQLQETLKHAKIQRNVLLEILVEALMNKTDTERSTKNETV